MSKPTLFFSHSSKDKDIIFPIKEKINQSTGGVFDIFLSSDGESIPFGRNWLHKIENGLQVAKIMFVFVTENSLSSGWIYFEAGFAYSKGIQVIPVGIGVDIGSLKPPLNLLQGFNITSGDSLNNFISIINDAFNYTFTETFTESDYHAIIGEIFNKNILKYNIEDIMRYAEYDILSRYTSNNEIVTHDLDNIFEKIEQRLHNDNITYSSQVLSNTPKEICIVVYGMQITYHKKKDPNTSNIHFRISLYNFEKSFNLLKDIIEATGYKSSYVKFHFKDSYNCISSIEDISSIISETDYFQQENDRVDMFNCNDLNLRFWVYNDKKHEYRSEPEYVLSLAYSYSDCDVKNIFTLINKLYDLGIIYSIHN